jgi:hypothetical protein
VRALRDFVLGRVVNGRQQIRAAMSIHIYERSIMWPYGYTRADVPRTMTAADHDAFAAIGHHMADLNGYTPKQLSDLYLQDGDAPDWLYGNQRIFAMLIEMYPTSDPKGDDIAGEVALNRDAMLYFIEQADCPYRAAGTQAVNCGPAVRRLRGRPWLDGESPRRGHRNRRRLGARHGPEDQHHRRHQAATAPPERAGGVLHRPVGRCQRLGQRR